MAKLIKYDMKAREAMLNGVRTLTNHPVYCVCCQNKKIKNLI